MPAAQILALAERAGVGPQASVLDLCCGVAGPGRFAVRELGCGAYLGVDASEEAVQIARERAVGLPCRFEVGQIPPLPVGTFDVVLLFETLLAFRDKRPLLQAVAGALATGGRFACTLEEGAPLTASEREQMPGADTVWLTPVGEMLELLGDAGLEVCWQDECSAAHLASAQRLTAAFAADQDAIAAQIGRSATEALVTSHRLWCAWLESGRVRKFALVIHARRGRLTSGGSGGLTAP
jgi:SAM-dependent methyltransferase